MTFNSPSTNGETSNILTENTSNSKRLRYGCYTNHVQYNVYILYSVCGCVPCCVHIYCTVCVDVLHVVYISIVQCVWMCCMLCTYLLYSVCGCVACCVHIYCTVCVDVLHVVYISIVQCVWMCCMLCTYLLYSVCGCVACCVQICCTMFRDLLYNMYRSEQFLCNRSKFSLTVWKEPCLKAMTLWRTHENL